ncbi:hypothetical protein [Brevundimonas sp.]|uniref:hypothetical protein n=1 Tax=Brevundimonas sp. TaxID=1871086 RepID=UPI003A945EE4
MSADEFDPFVERLFNQAPVMADAALFAQKVETRLQSGTRVRTVALTLAGLVGGVVAVRETMSVNLTLSANEGPVTGGALEKGIQSAGGGVQSLFQAGFDQMSLGSFSLAGLGGIELFWLTTALLVAVAAVGVMKLSEEI